MNTVTLRTAAFTLIEMMVSLAAGSTILVALALSSISLQKGFFRNQDYANEAAAQLRVLDYLGRDLRGSLTVTIPDGGQSVSLQLPSVYSTYDSVGNPTSGLVDPSIVNGVPQYGDTTKPVVITYFVSGNSLIRQQQVQTTNQQTQIVVAANVNNMQMAFTNQGTVLNYQITFAPRYNYGNSSTIATGTVVKGTMSVRAIRFK